MVEICERIETIKKRIADIELVVRLSRDKCCNATPLMCDKGQVCLRAHVYSPYGNFFLSGCHTDEENLSGCDFHTLPHNSSVHRCVCKDSECQNKFPGDCSVEGISVLRTTKMSSNAILMELERERDRRILSIQSHVVHGYAGNKCSVFPLQLHGFEVDFINSVQFSNHAGTIEFLSLAPRYANVKGQRLDAKDLEELYEGLKLNNINNYSHILTGYCGNVTFLEKIVDVVKDIKEKNPDSIFICDPVLGDNGRYYTPLELMPVYRDAVLPLADVLTPNAFELGELTGYVVNTENECLKAINALHKKGIRTIVVTSGVTNAQTETTLRCYASVWENGSNSSYRFTFPRLLGAFVGTGDVFASLLLVWLEESRYDIAIAVKNTLGCMQALIKKTSEYAQGQCDSNSKATCELRLIQSRKELLWPPNTENISVEIIE
ncbi:unnamed protein product [Caenorhabditis bovis]|uniref:pyridoxal kinase n=1 Tax=Caenorhabditis bovis TaxID=2654633 RepID=A0A8S1F5N9_9PELO|nr:unnamed protein product [Caenorhabditis bovis]